MTFEKILRSLIWRNLRSLGSHAYIEAEEMAHRPYQLQLPLAEGETLLGIYENVPHTLERALALTTRGLHLHHSNGWQFIAYQQIQAVHFPATKALTEEKVLNLTLTNGESVTLPVEGQPDPTRSCLRDLWVVGHFLERVLETTNDPARFPQ
jgi:hypothetical protein